MRITTLNLLVATSLAFLPSACKRSEPEEPAAAGQDKAPPIAHEADQSDREAGDTAQEPAQPSEPQAEESGAGETEPSNPPRIISPIVPGKDWVKVSARTPKGATVSLSVPDQWVALRPPNEATLLVRGAPIDTPGAGTKATIVAKDFEGGLTKLIEETKGRLVTFAAIKHEGRLRAGAVDGYELVASWSTPVGTKDTVQLLVATGKEAIGVTCEVPPGELDALRGLCDEIFGTLSIEGATPKKR